MGRPEGIAVGATRPRSGRRKSLIGLLFVAFSAGYVLAGAANGWLLRRLGLRGDLVFGTAVLAASTFVAGLRPAFGALLGLTVLFGFGATALLTVILLTNWWRIARRMSPASAGG